MDSLEGAVRQLYPTASVFFEQQIVPQLQKIREQLAADASKAEVSAEIAHLKALYGRLATLHCQDKGETNANYAARMAATIAPSNPIVSCDGYGRVVQVAIGLLGAIVAAILAA